MNRLPRIACLLFLFVCSHLAAFAQVSVSLSPNPGEVQPGDQLQFVATVTGTSNNVVIWSLSGPGCSGIACGQITGQGVYLAPTTPLTPPIATVTATSLADLTKSASANVYVGTALNATVSVSPASVGVVVGQQQGFIAVVTGASDTDVTWSVAGSGCSGAACGVISDSGVYTAPGTVPTPATVTVTATSVANPLKSSTATVTILPPVAVSISPQTASVVVGKTQQFTATVVNTSNTTVTWSVTGSGCSGSTCGTVSSSGLYTAPGTVPSPAQVTVTATSIADSTKSASATVTILPPVNVSISPTTADVDVGKTQQFTATVINTSNTAVTWSVTGSGCSGSGCGTVSSSGLYTAPGTVPSPAQVTVTATSVADSSKSASAIVTILPVVAVTISPTSAEVVTGNTQQFSATVTGASNIAVTWTLNGTGCSGATCGTISSSGLYTAPAMVPSPAQVSVTATSVADPTKSASAVVTILHAIVVSVSPGTAQVVTGMTQQFTATVSGTSNMSVTWTLSGSGCSGSACGTISSSGLYTAPTAVPSPPQVTVTATSVADPTKSATATVTVVPLVRISISPGAAQVLVGATQQFTATVTGTTDTAVTWSLSGAGCSGATCGTISSSGLFTAPAAVPSPAEVTVTATSNADSTESASASVTILPLVAIHISPTTAQIVVGNTQQFTATVTGTTNTAVTWSVAGAGCSGSACGTVSSSGLYTAPAAVPSPAQVTVTVTSVADSTKSSAAQVTILPAISVSISPNPAEVATGTQQQFTATVLGTSNTAVTWSLSGAGCSGSACGSITPSGLFTAPTVVPTPAQIKITATSEANNAQSGSAVVTIILPLAIRVTPANSYVAIDGSEQFRAAVAGMRNAAVSWSTSGPGCSGATCGTITSGGLYTAPASLPSPATVTITAAAQADPSQVASATVILVASNNAKLVGQYAFLFKGIDSNGVYQAGGTFIADGNGNLTSGLEDANNSSAPSTDIPFTGTYQVGGDGRGVMTFSGALGSHTFRFALDALGTGGHFIEFDQSGIYGSGIFEQQDPSAFTTAELSGTYVMKLTGGDSVGHRLGAVGQIYCKAGIVSIGSLDVNDGGVVSPTFAPFDGDYRVQSTGRGTVDLSIPGFDGGSFRFAVYVVSSSEYFMISIDPLSDQNPLISGPVELQTGESFTNESFQGPSVFTLNGNDGSVTQGTAGQLVFDGNSGVTVTFDQNTGGNITTGATLTGAYDVQINGRGTLNLDNNNGTSSAWDFYAISPNRAFLLDASTSFVADGELKPQSTASPFINSDALGDYLFGSEEIFSDATPVQSGVVDFDGTNVNGQGGVAGTEDIAQESSLLLDQTVTGAYSIFTSLNDGRGSLQLTSPAKSTIALWVINDSALVGLSVDSSDTQPAILIFEQ